VIYFITTFVHSRFLSGLAILGVLEAIRNYPELLREAFVYTPRQINAAMMMALIDVEPTAWSEKGSNRRFDEERAYQFWCDYILDIKG